MKLRLRLNRGNVRTWLIVAGCLVARPTALTLIVGWLLLVPGAMLHLWAKGCLHQNTEVTCAGPYRRTRNPFYLANFIIDLAICIVINRPLVYLVYLSVWFWVYRREILDEERHLEELFGDRYREYKARVPRFWPIRRPARDLVETLPFSWQNPNLAWGSEYGRLVRTFATPLLILVCREVWTHRLDVLTMHHSLALSAITLLAILTLIEWAVVRRFKRGRRLVPPVLQHWAAHAGVLCGFALVAATSRFLETELDRLVFPVGLGLFVLSFLSLLLPRAASLSPPAIRWGEAACCLVGGILAELPWLGLLGAGYFGVLAIDSTRTLTFLSSPDVPSAPRISLRTQRAIVLAAMVLFVVLGFAKNYVTDGGWPQWSGR